MRPGTPGLSARYARRVVRVLTWRRCLLAVALTVALPANARAQSVLPTVLPKDILAASEAQLGVIGLAYGGGQQGTRVFFYERTAGKLKQVGVSTVNKPPVAALPAAVRWRCDRVVRHFEATAVAPDGTRSQGTTDIRTPSCANRLALSVPKRLALGATARIRVNDRWLNGGIRPRLCITAPGARRVCRVLAFQRTVDIAGRRFRATKRGLWRVELRLRGHRERAAVAVGGARYVSPAPRPRVLADGDSMMVGLDSFLADRLADTVTVRSDWQAGAGVGQDFGRLTRAAALTRKHKPRTTVMLVAEAGYAMQSPDGAKRQCCDALWAAEYTRRVRLIMKTYIQKGRGHVLWLTLPTPRHAELAKVTAVQTIALLRAAQGLAGARILRLDQILTPNGYRETMVYRGQTVRVRQSDGLHLTTTGASIAAEAVEKALRASPGWLGSAARLSE